MRRRQAFLLPWALTGLGGVSAHAQDAAPRTVLSVTGLVAPAPAGGWNFTLAELEGLGLVEMRTATPWTRGEQAFSGVPLLRLLEHVGARGELLRASALNDYTVEVPASDARNNGAILVTRLDGQPMKVRDRGPVWLLYPFSGRPDLDNARIHERAIWQLRRIEVR